MTRPDNLQVLRRKRERQEAERKERQRRDGSNNRSDQTHSTKAAVLLFQEGTNAAVETVAQSTTVMGNFQAMTQAAGHISAVAQSIQATTGIGAATARVRHLVDAGMSASQSFAPIASAATSAMATVGPFAVLAIAASLGIDNAETVANMASKLSDATAQLIATAISDATTVNAVSEAEILAAPDAIADLIKQSVAESFNVDVSIVTSFLTGAKPIPIGDHPTSVNPFDLSIDGSSVPENSSGLVVGTLSGQSGGPGDITWTIVNGHGFHMEGATLVADLAYNFESDQPVTVTIQAKNHAGFVTTMDVVVAIIDVNEAPSTPTFTSTFDGHQLVVTLQSIDPDGNPLTYVRDGVPIGGSTLIWTTAELAAGAPTVHMLARDPLGLESGLIEIVPPQIAANVARDHPVPPTILAIDLASVPENQSAVAHVTAYDAIDGLIIRDVVITPQDFEALIGKRAELQRIDFDVLPPGLDHDGNRVSIVNGALDIRGTSGSNYVTIPFTLDASRADIEIKFPVKVTDASEWSGTSEIFDLKIKDSAGNIVASQMVHSPAKPTLEFDMTFAVGSLPAGDYSLSIDLDEPGDDNSNIAIDEIVMTAGPPPENPFITIPVEIANSNGLTASINAKIEITDVNEAPSISFVQPFLSMNDGATGGFMIIVQADG